MLFDIIGEDPSAIGKLIPETACLICRFVRYLEQLSLGCGIEVCGVFGIGTGPELCAVGIRYLIGARKSSDRQRVFAVAGRADTADIGMAAFFPYGIKGFTVLPVTNITFLYCCDVLVSVVCLRCPSEISR